MKRSPNGRKSPKRFFWNGRRSENLGAKPEEPQGPHKPPPRGQGARHPGLWAPWRSPDLDLAPINSQIFPKKSGEHRNHFSATASFCLRKIPSGARSGALPEGGFGYGDLSDVIFSLLDLQCKVLHDLHGDLSDVTFFCGVFVEI